MSGYGSNEAEGGVGFTSIGAASIGTELTKLLLAEDIQPGSATSYQTAKTIFLHHPLGAKMAEVPVNMAQSQAREISVSAGPESVLIPAFNREWRQLGRVGADVLIKNTRVLSRVYGIASVGVGERNGDTSAPLDLETLATADLFFNVFDPLNTAGSLVLDQDPNSPDFLKPKALTISGKAWHPSRTCVVMNEQPIYIAFTNSAFGFVGRSVYQRALFPLKSMIQSMITDQYVIVKCGLLIAKMKAPGSFINNTMMKAFGWKRDQLKGGVTGNVLTIGETEAVESLNFQNLEGPARMARENILKNIAMAAGMPARLLDQETMASGLSDGTEDAKQIARYIDRERIEMAPIYGFFDDIVMRRAWSEEFYEAIKGNYPEYKKVPYETAFTQWRNSFEAIWPNLLEEPDSEKAKVDEIRFKSATALVEVGAPLAGPKNKAELLRWMQDQANNCEQLFTSKLRLDDDELDNPPEPVAIEEADATTGEETKEPHSTPFSSHS
jgi:hypothetical protein